MRKTKKKLLFIIIIRILKSAATQPFHHSCHWFLSHSMRYSSWHPTTTSISWDMINFINVMLFAHFYSFSYQFTKFHIRFLFQRFGLLNPECEIVSDSYRLNNNNNIPYSKPISSMARTFFFDDELTPNKWWIWKEKTKVESIHTKHQSTKHFQNSINRKREMAHLGNSYQQLFTLHDFMKRIIRFRW